MAEAEEKAEDLIDMIPSEQRGWALERLLEVISKCSEPVVKGRGLLAIGLLMGFLAKQDEDRDAEEYRKHEPLT